MSRYTLLALCLVGFGACETLGPEPGAVSLHMRSPHPEESALMIRLTGPGLSNVQSNGGADVVEVRETGPDQVEVILVGQLEAGPLITLEVPDRGELSEHTVEPLQIASPTFALREDLNQYEFFLTMK